jgi:hypothetical protein
MTGKKYSSRKAAQGAKQYSIRSIRSKNPFSALSRHKTGTLQAAYA